MYSYPVQTLPYEVQTTQKTRHASIHNQNAISASIAPNDLPLPRHTMKKYPTQGSGYDIADPPPYAQEAVHHEGINKAITFVLASLGDLFHHSRPNGRPGSGGQAVQDTEHVQHGEGHCQSPKEENRYGRTHGCEDDACRDLHFVGHDAHDDAAGRRGDIEQYHRQC